jgi:uncharacterized membrane protein
MGPDEPSHLFRAYQISEGGILAQRRGEAVGGRLPKNLIESMKDGVRLAEYQPLPPWHVRLTGPLSLTLPLHADDKAFVDFRNVSQFTPVPYLPQAAVLAVARTFEPAPVALLFIARLTGLATSLALIFLAIRTTPMAKWVLVMLALTPTALRQMSVMSADTVTNATSMLLIALLLRAALGPDAGPLQGRRLAIVAALFLVVALSKQAYFPMLLLYFVLPVEALESQRRYVLGFLAIAGSATALFVLWFWLVRSLYAAQWIAPKADPWRQMAVIQGDPVRFALMILGEVRAHWGGLLDRYVGIVPEPFRSLYPLILAGVALLDGKRHAGLTLRAKALLAVVFVATLAMLHTFAYLAWNPVGASTIRFVQGRYLVPIAPLFFLLLTNRRLSSVVPERALGAVASTMVVVGSALSIQALLGRWYGTG